MSQQVEEITQEQFKKMVELIESIGEGSFGQVWRAKYKNKNVAIKQFNYKANKDAQTIFNEISALKNVKSRNLVELVAALKVDKKKYYIITQYCVKGDLKKNIVRILGMSQKNKLRLLKQIANGIKQLHDKNIMHRDIKPENILLNQFDQVKICDFGCSKIQNSINQTNNVGTPLYSDPQVSNGSYTKKCDIFSTGMVIYYIYTGKCIFQNCSTKHDLFKAHEAFFNKFKTNIDNFLCPDEIKSLLRCTLAQKEEDRYNANELENAIETILKNKIQSNCTNTDTVVSRYGSSNYKNINKTKADIILQTNIQSLISINTNVENQKDIAKYKTQLFEFIAKNKAQIKKLSEIENLPFSNQVKEFLIFIALFYYVALNNQIICWTQKKQVKISKLKDININLIDKQTLSKIEKYAIKESDIAKQNLINLAQQYLLPKFRVVKEQLTSKLKYMITTYQDSSFERIDSFNLIDIKQEYNKYFVFKCNSKQNTQNNKQSYLCIQELLNKFDA